MPVDCEMLLTDAIVTREPSSLKRALCCRFFDFGSLSFLSLVICAQRVAIGYWNEAALCVTPAVEIEHEGAVEHLMKGDRSLGEKVGSELRFRTI